MSKLKEKFLEVYSLATLRDIDYLGGSPDNNALLRFRTALGKWIPSRLSVDFAAKIKNPSERIVVKADEFLILKSPDIAEHGMDIEGSVDVI